MHKFAAILCLGLGTWAASAQVSPRPVLPSDSHTGPGAVMHPSLTRQFVVRELNNPDFRPIPLGKDTSVHYTRIDPTLFAVSCERIKHALLKELDAPDRWHDQIFIDMRRARTLNDTVIIASTQTSHDWSYHVSMPDTVENTRLITSIVDVLLLEMANRDARRSAEIPAWLGYGLSQDIIRSSQIELLLEPVKPDANGLKIGTVTVPKGNMDTMAIAWADLHASPPLTLDQLSWPDEARLDGPEGETYRSSAQLLVRELLRLGDGRAAMQAFVQELPQHLNWQLSFLHAFRGDFGGQLDLEKWWALRLVDFTGRDISRTWSLEESWQKLDEIIHPVIDVRTHADELPHRTRMTLQNVIEKWDAPRQMGFLKDKSKQLYVLRSRVSQEFAKLVDDYRKTIDVYLEARAQNGYLRTPRAQAVLGPDNIDRQTIGDLNLLDSIREDLRPKAQTVQSANAN